MNRFELFKFLHVIGAVVWVGAGIALTLLSVRLRGDHDRSAILAIGRHSEWLGKLLFMPAALTTLLFGVLMVATEARFAFTDLWIIIGFGAVAASFVVGVLLMEPADRKAMALVEEFGVDNAEVDQQLVRVLRLSAIDVGILIVAVWAMVAKPML